MYLFAENRAFAWQAQHCSIVKSLLCNGPSTDDVHHFMCAGSMAMFVVVLSGMKSGRIDANMLTRIVEIVSSGKPTLITINQMGRFLDWVEDAEDASARCAEYCRDITDHAKQHGPCGAVSVMLTDFTEHHAHYEEMERKGINSAEDVSATAHDY